MAREHDSQAAEQLGRDADQLLAEYFRIRREYNALDRDNPSHAERRAELRSRYHELDRKYTDLVKSQDELVAESHGHIQHRADVLWQGAIQAPARVSEPIEGPADEESADGPWVELTTPVEGAATDRIFEEALRQAEEASPHADSRDAAAPPVAEQPHEPDFDGPNVFSEPDAGKTTAESDAPALEAPEFDERGNGLDRPARQAPFAVDALRELTEHLRSGQLDDIDRDLSEPTPLPVVDGARAELAQPLEPYVEIDHGHQSPVLPLAPGRRRKRTEHAKEAAKLIACVSCGERLPAGTQSCRYCGARIVSGDTAEGPAQSVLPHLQLQLSEPKPTSNFGAKSLILFGWLLVLGAAAWLVALNSDYGSDGIRSWLDARGMSMLRKDESGGIFGVAVTLLGSTLIGIGIFATRFVRIVVSMHELARNGRVEVIEKLIVEGAELDQRDERGCTPLHFAVVAKQREVVAVLVGNGADVNSHNNRGDTPLHMAVANRDHALVQYLLKRGADVETVNDGGSTLMHVAAQVGDVGLLKLFAERGLSINQATKVGFTPLHFAAQSGHDSAIEFLLGNNSDPNLASDHGTTPIFPAVRNGHLNAVRLLVEAGADYNARRGHDFESPLGIARVHKRREIHEYLESIGAEG
jgi:ankyrin repeat protein